MFPYPCLSSSHHDSVKVVQVVLSTRRTHRHRDPGGTYKSTSDSLGLLGPVRSLGFVSSCHTFEALA